MCYIEPFEIAGFFFFFVCNIFRCWQFHVVHRKVWKIFLGYPLLPFLLHWESIFRRASWLWNLFTSQKSWQIHLPGVSDKHNILPCIDGRLGELEFHWIVSAHQSNGDRLMSFQPKLCKIAYSSLWVSFLQWVARGTSATQWHTLDKLLNVVLHHIKHFFLPCKLFCFHGHTFLFFLPLMSLVLKDFIWPSW